MHQKTALAIMKLHRKQMVDALATKGNEDMLGFEWACFLHRQVIRDHLPAVYELWAIQNPEKAAQELARSKRQSRKAL